MASIEKGTSTSQNVKSVALPTPIDLDRNALLLGI